MYINTDPITKEHQQCDTTYKNFIEWRHV